MTRIIPSREAFQAESYYVCISPERGIISDNTYFGKEASETALMDLVLDLN